MVVIDHGRRGGLLFLLPFSLRLSFGSALPLATGRRTWSFRDLVALIYMRKSVFYSTPLHRNRRHQEDTQPSIERLYPRRLQTNEVVLRGAQYLQRASRN